MITEERYKQWMKWAQIICAQRKAKHMATDIVHDLIIKMEKNNNENYDEFYIFRSLINELNRYFVLEGRKDRNTDPIEIERIDDNLSNEQINELKRIDDEKMFLYNNILKSRKILTSIEKQLFILYFLDKTPKVRIASDLNMSYYFINNKIKEVRTKIKNYVLWQKEKQTK